MGSRRGAGRAEVQERGARPAVAQLLLAQLSGLPHARPAPCGGLVPATLATLSQPPGSIRVPPGAQPLTPPTSPPNPPPIPPKGARASARILESSISISPTRRCRASRSRAPSGCKSLCSHAAPASEGRRRAHGRPRCCNARARRRNCTLTPRLEAQQSAAATSEPLPTARAWCCQVVPALGSLHTECVP